MTDIISNWSDISGNLWHKHYLLRSESNSETFMNPSHKMVQRYWRSGSVKFWLHWNLSKWMRWLDQKLWWDCIIREWSDCAMFSCEEPCFHKVSGTFQSLSAALKHPHPLHIKPCSVHAVFTLVEKRRTSWRCRISVMCNGKVPSCYHGFISAWTAIKGSSV